MWGIVAKGLIELTKTWFDSKSKRMEARAQAEMALAKIEADYDNLAMQQAQYSWKDEFITLIWYSPLLFGWWNQEKGRLSTAPEWISFVDSLPHWWWVGAYGILAATFGLRWYFKEQKVKVIKNKQVTDE